MGPPLSGNQNDSTGAGALEPAPAPAPTTATTTTVSSSSVPVTLDPVSAATLYDLEVARRRGLLLSSPKAESRAGVGAGAGAGDGFGARFGTGCAEVDREVLLGGGFERGSVVGVSAEDVDFGVLFGLQTVAHTLVFSDHDEGDGNVDWAAPARPRAAIITTLPATTLLPMLRDVIRAQVLSRLSRNPAAAPDATVATRVRACLERISVSQIFDIEGLWEVIGELKTPPPPQSPPRSPPPPLRDERVTPSPAAGASHGDVTYGGGGDVALSSDSELSDPPPSSPLSATAVEDPPVDPSTRGGRDRKGEVLDSEDEGEELSPSPSPPPPPSPPPSLPAKEKSQSPANEITKENEEDREETHLKNREGEAQGAQVSTKDEGSEPSSRVPDMILITHFSSLLTTLFTRRDRAGAHSALALLSSHLRYLARTSGPLIMLLNTTSSPPPGHPNHQESNRPRPAQRPLDPTLRSIFGHNSGGDGHRVNKPAYGATFAGLLDTHLLCTRAPRARADAEALLSHPPQSALAAPLRCRYAWVVEVLMDEVGVWEWRRDGDAGREGGRGGEGELRWTRRCREQRWGAVDVRDRVRIVDAFVG